MWTHNLLFLSGFLGLILAGCASQPPYLRQAETEPLAATAPVVKATDRASKVALRALAHLGTPYRMGGLSPQTGFDCSGLVVHVYGESAGLALPRTTSNLSQVGEPVERVALRPGDLVFFDTKRGVKSHVGIYLGEDRFIHAPSSGGEVRVENLRAGYWMQRYNGARRVIALH